MGARDPGHPGGPGDPGQLPSSWATSARHRVVTRLMLIRMAPRRARARRALRTGSPISAPTAVPVGDPGLGGATRTLVVAHVYYPELWAELAERIRVVPDPVDLVVTLVRGRADHLAVGIRAEFPGAVVRIVENRGRDMWPLLQVLDQVPGHDVVLKLHTKRSPHMRSGDAWRRDLLHGLCASPEQAGAVAELLRRDRRIGVIAAPRNVLGREFMGTNADTVAALVTRSGRRYHPDRLWFPAGSMFWARSEVLLALADLGLQAEDFGEETGATDGTLPHALERFLGVVAETEGLAVVESTEVGPLLARVGTR